MTTAKETPPMADPDLIAEERRAYARQPDHMLANVERALSSLAWLNTAREDARLAAVKSIRAERRKAKRQTSKGVRP
jgi:hypothetical protein